jgi:hypothetical protein
MALTSTSQPSQPRPLRQSRYRQLRGDDWDAPLFWCLSALLGGAAGLFFLLYSLCQPAMNRNPGLAAYVPPPATRLVPAPRKSDAPELAVLLADPPIEPPSPLTAMAKAQPGDQQAKRDMHPPARKRPRVDYGEYDQRGPGYVQPGYVQQWNFGNHGWSNNHAWSGGPKSWF